MTQLEKIILICIYNQFRVKKIIVEVGGVIEYSTDTSAGHPVKDDDIVRYSLETRRVQDKELEQ